MELFGFEIFWYCVIILALIAFATLDGFDLGVGVIHFTAKTDEERRLYLNAIGPVWDGNAVWLVILSGGLLAGFPGAFGTLFSSFYDLMMILLAGIIFRAVAIEFRSKHPSKVWRFSWDFLFSFASLIISFCVGLLLGNLVVGIPLDDQFSFVGNFANYFTVYTVSIAVTTVLLFMMHGAIFLVLKTEGEVHDRLRKQVNWYIGFSIALCVLITVLTYFYNPHMIENLYDHPWLFICPLLTLLFILDVPREMRKGRDGFAFIASSLSIAFLLALFALGIFPNLVRSSLDPVKNSVTIYNSSASTYTYFVLMIIVIIGVPLVLGYSIWIYRIFKEKVKLDSTSY